jgi:protein-S-isoprenylcysteine O-methyltransferase Ste14
MTTLNLLSITMIAIWCFSEIVISLISIINRIRGFSKDADRYSYIIVWLSTIPPIVFEYLVRVRPNLLNGMGDLSFISPMIGYLGCLVLCFGITIRLMAVATLRQQFTLKVSITKIHKIIHTGIYGVIRHPAYLGHIISLIGIGFILGNWVGLIAIIFLPLAGVLYRINVEERALLQNFGPEYQTYIDKTKKLFPGIW